MDDDLFEELSELKKSPEKKSEDNKESSDPIGFPVCICNYILEHPIHFGLDQILFFRIKVLRKLTYSTTLMDL